MLERRGHKTPATGVPPLTAHGAASGEEVRKIPEGGKSSMGTDVHARSNNTRLKAG